MPSSEKLSITFKFIKDFKEVVTIIVFFFGLSLAAYSHFAPASLVLKLECGLESHRLLAIKLDEQSSNLREKISSQEQERLLTDFLLLIVSQPAATDDLKLFKKNLVDHLKPKRDSIRKKVTDLEIAAAEINKEVTQAENKVTKRVCPNV